MVRDFFLILIGMTTGYGLCLLLGHNFMYTKRQQRFGLLLVVSAIAALIVQVAFNRLQNGETHFSESSNRLTVNRFPVQPFSGPTIQPFTSVQQFGLVSHTIATTEPAAFVMSAAKTTYHRPGCRYAKQFKADNIRAFQTIGDVPAGSVPCKYCCVGGR